VRSPKPPIRWASTSTDCATSTPFVGGVLAGLAGATISLSVSPGWYSSQTTSGQGWIAVGLVIFAQWSPLRAALGAYLFGALRRGILGSAGPRILFGFVNPLYINSNWGFFLQMTPYILTILALVIGARAAARKRLGAPAALGLPYIRRGDRPASVPHDETRWNAMHEIQKHRQLLTRYEIPATVDAALQLLREYGGAPGWSPAGPICCWSWPGAPAPASTCSSTSAGCPNWRRITVEDNGTIHLGPLVTHNQVVTPRQLCRGRCPWRRHRLK
jgi:hypothetical protein